MCGCVWLLISAQEETKSETSFEMHVFLTDVSFVLPFFVLLIYSFF